MRPIRLWTTLVLVASVPPLAAHLLHQLHAPITAAYGETAAMAFAAVVAVLLVAAHFAAVLRVLGFDRRDWANLKRWLA